LILEFAKNEVQPNLYSYTELKIATEDFSPDMRLGQGGFGVVYKGILPDGTELAVKQLTNSDHGLAEFLNEIVTISCVKHRNLVKLKGCSIKGDQRLLVYEYVENKNLAEALWGTFHVFFKCSRPVADVHTSVLK
jgi:serine/threonine protein kinase